MLAESLTWPPEGTLRARHLQGDTDRIAAIVLAYSALFHQVARSPFIEQQRIDNIHGWQIQATGECGHGALIPIRSQ